MPSPSAPWTPGQFLLREMRSFPIDELELDWFNSSVLEKGQSLVSPQRTSKHKGFVGGTIENVNMHELVAGWRCVLAAAARRQTPVTTCKPAMMATVPPPSSGVLHNKQ